MWSRRQGYTVLLTNADEDPERERRAMLALRSRRVDGMVVVPAPGAGREAFLDGPPLVQLDRAVRGAATDAVMVHNAAGAGSAVDHLLALGHTRIGMVTDSPQISSSAERIAGYRRALRAKGLLDESLISVGGSSQADGLVAARALLDRPDRPTAIFTANNFMTARRAAGGARAADCGSRATWRWSASMTSTGRRWWTRR